MFWKKKRLLLGIGSVSLVVCKQDNLNVKMLQIELKPNFIYIIFEIRNVTFSFQALFILILTFRVWNQALEIIFWCNKIELLTLRECDPFSKCEFVFEDKLYYDLRYKCIRKTNISGILKIPNFVNYAWLWKTFQFKILITILVMYLKFFYRSFKREPWSFEWHIWKLPFFSVFVA